METLFKDNYLCSTNNVAPNPVNQKSAQAFIIQYQPLWAFSSFISGEWVPLSEGLIWFLCIETKVKGQLISLSSVGVATQPSSNRVFRHKPYSVISGNFV